MAAVGRPRTFDRTAALERAMHVFWEKGYEGTTMVDLIQTIGVKAPSVYAAFGNKDALFKQAVKTYSELVGIRPVNSLLETNSIYEAIKKSLQDNVEIFTSPNNPSSCLIFSAAINCSPEHLEHTNDLRELRQNFKGVYKDRIEKAVLAGEFKDHVNSEELAEFFMAFVHGLAMRAKDGSAANELSTSCEFALSLLKLQLKNPPIDSSIISEVNNG